MCTDYIKRMFNREIVRDFVNEFLPRDKYLEIKLQEICSQCPLNDGEKGNRNFSEYIMDNIDTCRKRYFGLILRSFVGKPGDEETDRLYSYLKKCEDCLFSRTGVDLFLYVKS
jgi:hypothetical protein